MKKIYTSLVAVLLTALSFAQVPQGFNYQAVYRDVSGNIMPNENVTVKISILKGAVDGTEVFTETHVATTNDYGLINLVIGSVNTTDLPIIDWSTDPYFLLVNINGNQMGANQLLSVPFAFHAKTADSITGTITETDPEFTAWDKSTGISITESQINDLQSYLSAEVDPVYSSSNASNITVSDITNLGNLSGTNTGDQTLTTILTANTSAGNNKITDLSDPADSQDAATKAYVDALELKIKTLEDALVNAGISVLTDFDGNLYKTVAIGEQRWMMENLKTTTLNDGTPLLLNDPWSGINEPAYFIFQLEAPGGSTIGPYYYYNYDAVYTEKLCPIGWHVPTDADWMELESFLGMDVHELNEMGERGRDQEIGFKLQDESAWGYDSGATNESGFTAIPEGSVLEHIDLVAYFWTSTSDKEIEAWVRWLEVHQEGIFRGTVPFDQGLSVRCLRDN